MTTYTVKAANGSKTAWKFFLQPVSELTLAWLVTPFKVPIGDTFVFNWRTNYQFMWSATGLVMPGIIVKVGGQKNCDPEGANTTRFTFRFDVPEFSDPVHRLFMKL